MKNSILLIIFMSISSIFNAQNNSIDDNPNIYTSLQIDSLLRKPVCLDGYFTNQTGYLTKIDSGGKESFDTTFSVEQLKILSEDVYINGWLYMPMGDGIYPFIVLANGGGNITNNIRSFSDWIAPVLAHCGIACFVHDKRGTGESEGIFRNTTYEDYIRDVGNCVRYFMHHSKIDTNNIGVMGASEGGRIAIIAASRYPEIKFVISYQGTVVSAVDDRIYAQKGWLESMDLPDSSFSEVFDMHIKSIKAWASDLPVEHEKLKHEIYKMREKYDARVLPYTKEEMDSIPDFIIGLSTWYSLKYDYLSEMEHFTKKWLAIFGEEDIVVPTERSIKNINYYMKISGNKDYNIAVIPECGHGVLNTKTRRIIRVNHMIINWINDRILNEKSNNTDLIDSLISVNKINSKTLLIRFGPDAVTAINTEGGIVIIDAGISTGLTFRYRKIIDKELYGKKISYVINTHAHSDHYGGNSVFAEAQIIAHKNGIEEMDKQWKDTSKVISSISKIVNEYEIQIQNHKEYTKDWVEAFTQSVRYKNALLDAQRKNFIKQPTITFSDSMFIDMGDLKFELMFFGKCHSNSDILIYIPQLKLLFSGDLFFKYGRPSINDKEHPDKEKWEKAVIWIEERLSGIETIISGHGEILSKEDLIGFNKRILEYCKE